MESEGGRFLREAGGPIFGQSIHRMSGDISLQTYRCENLTSLRSPA
jgi:hypothetical protein